MTNIYSNLYSPEISNKIATDYGLSFQEPDFKKVFVRTNLSDLMDKDAGSILIVGRRNTGKTFWGQKILDEKIDQVENAVVVSIDKYNVNATMENKLSQYSQYDKSIVNNIIKIREGIRRDILRPMLLLLDDPFSYKTQLEEIKQLLEKKDDLKITIVITCQYISQLPLVLDEVNHVLLLRNDNFKEIHTSLFGADNSLIEEISNQLTKNRCVMVVNVSSKTIAYLE